MRPLFTRCSTLPVPLVDWVLSCRVSSNCLPRTFRQMPQSRRFWRAIENSIRAAGARRNKRWSDTSTTLTTLSNGSQNAKRSQKRNAIREPITVATATARNLSGQFDCVFVPENPDGSLELLELERFFQNCNRPFSQDSVEHVAVGITGNDDDRAIGLSGLGHVVNVVGWTVWQF